METRANFIKINGAFAALLLILSVLYLTAFGSLTAHAAAAPVKIVAAGDSFTAGPGTGPSAESTSVYAAGTGPQGNQCYQSSWGYPQRLVERLSTLNITKTYSLTNASCAGTSSANITSDWTKQTSDGRTVVVPAQVSSIPADADYVVMTLGGNDVGFSNIVGCVVGTITSSTPDCTSTNPAIVSAYQDIATLSPKVTTALQAIQAKAPNAKIVIGGYPQIVPTQKTILQLGCEPWLSTGEMAIVNDIETKLNTAIQQAANATGATYVNQYKTEPYTTTVCSLTPNRQLNGIIALFPDASIHPNNQGAFASAALFGAKIQ